MVENEGTRKGLVLPRTEEKSKGVGRPAQQCLHQARAAVEAQAGDGAAACPDVGTRGDRTRRTGWSGRQNDRTREGEEWREGGLG